LDMEIDMTKLTKPIPGSHLHEYSDMLIKELIKLWRELRPASAAPEVYDTLIDDAFKVLGYRCAVEYVEKYGD